MRLDHFLVVPNWNKHQNHLHGESSIQSLTGYDNCVVDFTRISGSEAPDKALFFVSGNETHVIY